MCSMNQQTWSEVYDARLADPELLRESQVPPLSPNEVTAGIS